MLFSTMLSGSGVLPILATIGPCSCEFWPPGACVFRAHVPVNMLAAMTMATTIITKAMQPPFSIS
ncbi:MAG TPA: hypothetical protein PLO61_01250 [Fimbriimonadaceae bacterium]|nr:hypothetical protein [Fimbriimonadaceae bacterium]